MRKKKIKVVMGEPLIGFDLQNPNSYVGIKNPYHAVGRTSRTASEAFKDADYATPIWRCSSDFDRTMHFLAQMGVGIFQTGFVLGTLILVMYWILR